MTHIWISKLTWICSEYGLLHGWHEAIVWTNALILLSGTLWTNICEILIEMYTFSLKKMHFKMLSGKWCQFCLGLKVLSYCSSCTIKSFRYCTIYPKQLCTGMICICTSQHIELFSDLNNLHIIYIGKGWMWPFSCFFLYVIVLGFVPWFMSSVFVQYPGPSLLRWLARALMYLPCSRQDFLTSLQDIRFMTHQLTDIWQ